MVLFNLMTVKSSYHNERPLHNREITFNIKLETFDILKFYKNIEINVVQDDYFFKSIQIHPAQPLKISTYWTLMAVTLPK